MHARSALAFVLVAVSAGSVGSAPPEKTSGAVFPEGFLDSLENHADPATVLRVMDRELAGATTASIRRSLPGPRTVASGGPPAHRRSDRPYADVPLGADPGFLEYRPAVALSPRRQNVVVSAYVAASFPVPETRCLVTRSLDRGSTWSAPVFLPMLTGTSLCPDAPALAYAADGHTLFAAYRDFKGGQIPLEPPPGGGTRKRYFQETDILLSRSEDDGRTWSAPVLAIDGDGWSYVKECVGAVCTFLDEDPGETLERPTLATGPEAREAGWVYATANSLGMLQPADAPLYAVAFARSGDGGRHWSARTAIAEAAAGTPVTVQGGHVAAGAGGEVLVAWYDSGADGPRVGTFEIRTRRSGDHGDSWDDAVDAVVNEGELGPNLGPTPTLKSWWPGMFPDVAVDDVGGAHIVYTHDPEPGSATAEEGDIRYISSPRQPYRAWSSPVTVNDDGPGRAQGFPSLAARRAGRFPIVEVVWEDSRLAPVANFAYDIFHSRLTPGRLFSWSINRRVTDESSTQDGGSTGERTGLAANHSGLVFAVWTDRRDKTSTADGEDDVYGSRIAW